MLKTPPMTSRAWCHIRIGRHDVHRYAHAEDYDLHAVYIRRTQWDGFGGHSFIRLWDPIT